MSLVGIGIENGFAEIKEGCIIVYPKRVFNSSMLKQVVDEIQKDGYIAPETMNFSQPIVFKKKNRIDMTEVAVKLFSLAMSYGIDINIQSYIEAEVVKIEFVYKNKSVIKSFDIEMLCAMEKDYLTGWLEETLQKIDKAEENTDERK